MFCDGIPGLQMAVSVVLASEDKVYLCTSALKHDNLSSEPKLWFTPWKAPAVTACVAVKKRSICMWEDVIFSKYVLLPFSMTPHLVKCVENIRWSCIPDMSTGWPRCLLTDLTHPDGLFCSVTCCSTTDSKRNYLLVETLASPLPFWIFASVSLVRSRPSLLVECDLACSAKLMLSGVYYPISAFICRRRWKSGTALSSWRWTEEAASDGQPAVLSVSGQFLCACALQPWHVQLLLIN